MRQRLTRGQIETVRANLDALPAPDDSDISVDLQDAIRKLAPTLRKLLVRGYSRQQVVEFLAQSGINISPGTLKDYLGGRRNKLSASRLDGAVAGGTSMPGPAAPGRKAAGDPASRESPSGAERSPISSRTSPDVRSASTSPRRPASATE